ncbi:MAG: lipopolysaccharide heptosyltransferase II, partial [Kiritimatiellia bacterium]|nr:lipopolysaccharide heptosyltransferase II [Kiritimatiellia bacterium]
MTGSNGSASPDPAPDHGGVVLVSPSWIGDAILSLPALQAFHARNPTRPIHVLAKPRVASLWAMSPAVSGTILLKEGAVGVRAAAAELRAGGFSTAWILPNSWRSALVPWLGRVPERIGFSGHHRGWLLTRVVKDPVPGERRHQSVEMAELLSPADANSLPPPALVISSGTLDRLRDSLEDCPSPRVVLIPGAARGPSKRWPPERFAEAGRILARERGGSVLVCGAPGERELCAEVARQAGGQSWAGRTTLEEWAALLRLSDLVLCNDSGGMHLAAAVGAAGVAIFGVTDPEVTGPLGRKMRILQADGAGPVSRSVGRDSAPARKALDSIPIERVLEVARD